MGVKQGCLLSPTLFELDVDGLRNICLKLLTLMRLPSWELQRRCFCTLMTSVLCLRVHQDFKSSLML